MPLGGDHSTVQMTLHTSASATANGGLVPCHGIGAIGVDITNTGGTFTITFEGTINDSTWRALRTLQVSDTTIVTSTSTAGAYIVGVAGWNQFRARISAASGCSVSVTCVLYDGLADGMVDSGDLYALLSGVISAGKVAVTETSAASILTALQVIDNFISGSRGLVTEDNSAAIASSVALWGVNDVSTTVSSVTYVIKEKADGTWWMMKIDTSSGTAIGHASVTNNPTLTTATAAWAARATTAVFGDYSEAF